jgi:hypothetical protein
VMQPADRHETRAIRTTALLPFAHGVLVIAHEPFLLSCSRRDGCLAEDAGRRRAPKMQA